MLNAAELMSNSNVILWREHNFFPFSLVCCFSLSFWCRKEISCPEEGSNHSLNLRPYYSTIMSAPHYWTGFPHNKYLRAPGNTKTPCAPSITMADRELPYYDIGKVCRGCLGKKGEMRPLYGTCLDTMLMTVAEIQVSRIRSNGPFKMIIESPSLNIPGSC